MEDTTRDNSYFIVQAVFTHSWIFVLMGVIVVFSIVRMLKNRITR